MKRFLLCIILIVSLNLAAEIQLEIIGDNINITGDFNIDNIDEIISFDQSFCKINIEDCSNTGVNGGPELPVFSKLIALPDRGNYRIQSLNYDFEEIKLTKPLFPHFFEDNQEIDQSIYTRGEWYPQDLAKISSPNIMRDYRFSQLSINPIQYLPAENKIRILKKINLQLKLDIDIQDNPKLTNRSIHTSAFNNVAESSIINTPQFRSNIKGKYLFIVDDDLTEAIQLLARWKEKLGYATHVATISETGPDEYDVKDYIQNAYDNWNIPPDYVVLVGDVSGSFIVPSFDIEGYLTSWIVSDHIYTMLEGDDYFPDVMLGRLSIRSENELYTIINKIMHYEGLPYMENNWFTRALMITYVGEYYTGFYSPRETKNAVREKLLDFNYTTVDTFYSPYQSSTYQLKSLINTGCTFVNYRGSGSPYYWWSGYGPMFTNSDINNLNNGYMLPMVTSMTCGGADFGSNNYSSCFGEIWLKAGSPSTPKGAIGFIGPSEHDTKTPFNNANDMGIYHGITQENITRCYDMMLKGKMTLYNNYPDYHSMDGWNDSFDSDEFYFHTYNLLGDPGLSVWVDTPQPIFSTFDNEIPASATKINAAIVNDINDLAGFTVALTSPDSLITSAITDNSGEAMLYVSLEPGRYDITFSKVGFKPETGSIQVLNIDEIYLNEFIFNHPLMNNSTSNLLLALKNSTGTDIQIASSSLNIGNNDPYFTVEDNNAYPLNIALGASLQLDFDISAASEWNNWMDFECQLILDSSWGLDSLYFPLTTNSPELSLIDPGFTNEQEAFIPGEDIEINPLLENIGDTYTEQFTLVATSLSPELTITNSSIEYNNIPCMSQAQSSGTLNIAVSEEVGNGDIMTLQFSVIQENITVHSFLFNYPAGILDEDAPTRDLYGYRAYENRDNFPGDPILYEWFEIDPAYGGSGFLIEGGHETSDGFTKTLNLPFDFQYYGENYDQISVCQHGWFAMGNTSLTFFRNRTIPSGVGASAMVAPFWDKLIGDGVFGYYDEENHRFIVEWSRLNNGYSYDQETFQAILFDPLYYPTPTNDGPIMFQYNIISNNDHDEQYCTVGIENQRQTDGILINFNNTPSQTAHSLVSGSAILFTTGDPSITSSDESNLVPTIILHQNIPNPFNPSTTIRFSTSQYHQNALIEIYNTKGQSVKSIAKQNLNPGLTSVFWDGKDSMNNNVGSGIYFYRLSLDGNPIANRKMILMK